MASTIECPTPTRLESLLHGDLPQPEQDSLTEHVEGCARCQHAIEALRAPGASWEELAPGLAHETTQPEPLRAALEQAKALDSMATVAPTPAGPRAEGLEFLEPSDQPGHLGRLAHYEVLQVVGQGGFGTVLKAFDEKLHRMVAIKVLAAAYSASGAARKRFIREARAAAAVKNEHVVGIYDVKDEAQPPYLVMELIEGVALQDKLDKHGPLGVKEILRIGTQTAEGLAAAHKQGLVHRDIKPANILLENGVERVRITDFGLARAVDDASVTQSGTVAGTPMYMSPEQAAGETIDHRSDLFSLGSVLYAMCTGHPPFRATGTHAVLMRVIEDTPRPIREVNADIPDWLATIVAKLHAKKREDRFATAREVADLLGQHLAHLQQPHAAPQPAPVVVPDARLPRSAIEKLLEATDTSKRLQQHGGLLGVVLLGWAGMVLTLPAVGLIWQGLGLLAVAAIGAVGVARIKQRWNVTYRGHALRFENGCLTGQALFIDDVRMAGGGVGLRNELRAVIPHGDGVGEEIVVLAEAGIVQLHCRILVDRAPGPGTTARLAFAATFQRWLLGIAGAAALLLAAAAILMLWHYFPARHAVTIDVDTPDAVVRVWPTAQTAPPVNLAGGFDILGEPVQVFRGLGSITCDLPEGHYWVAAELDGQEAARVFMNIERDSFQTHHVEIDGNQVDMVGHTTVGWPRQLRLPAAANLVQRERIKLRGTWRVVATERDGRAMPQDEVDRDETKFEFVGETMSERRRDIPLVWKSKYTLNPRAKPATLTIAGIGPGDGDPMLAIYRWRTPHTILMCVGDRERPTDFSTAPDGERILMSLEREGAETAAKPPNVPPSEKDGWVRLFNGKDLAGWEAKLTDKTRNPFQVIDTHGFMIAEGLQGGYLRTEKQFGDFILEFECKSVQNRDIAKGHASGDTLFGMPSPDTTASGYRVSLVPGGQGAVEKLGEPAAQMPSPLVDWRQWRFDAQLGPEIWNRVTVEARRGKLAFTLNDAPVLASPNYPGGKGYIGIGGVGPGMCYRNIRIKELPAESRNP